MKGNPTSYKEKLEKKRIRETKIFTLFAVIAGTAIGIFFLFYALTYQPLPREEAVAFSGQLARYKESQSSRYGGRLYFGDDSQFELENAYETKELTEALQSLVPGTTLYLLIDPELNCVIEIRTESRELLNLDEAQQEILSERRAFIFIAILLFVCDILLLVITLLERKAKKDNKAAKQQLKKKKAAELGESPVLRHADPDFRHRVLLDARAEGYQICYRRVGIVNELIVNGRVYAEKKGFLEFEHTLFAVVDGHKIEAGTDDLSCSFISFDGSLLDYKQRII